MGLFLYNLYPMPPMAKTQLKSQLKKYYKAEGYFAVSEKLPFEIKLSLCGKGTDTFISLPGTSEDEMQALCQGLARQLRQDVLGAMVYDSDICVLVHASGKGEEGSLLTWEGGTERREEDVDSLVPLLQNAEDAGRLRNIWLAEHVFAEEVLEQVLPLFGLPVALHCPERDQSVLCFASLDESKMAYRVVRQGPPKLKLRSYGTTWVDYGQAGGASNMVSFCNEGGPSKGLTVILGGPYIEALAAGDEWELGDIDANRYLDGMRGKPDGSPPERYTQTAAFRPRNFSDGKTRLVAEFPAFEIPEGFVVTANNAMGFMAADKAMEHYTIFIRFHKIVMPALTDQFEGDIRKIQINVAPHENWAEGQIGHTVDFYPDNSKNEDYVRNAKMMAMDAHYRRATALPMEMDAATLEGEFTAFFETQVELDEQYTLLVLQELCKRQWRCRQMLAAALREKAETLLLTVLESPDFYDRALFMQVIPIARALGLSPVQERMAAHLQAGRVPKYAQKDVKDFLQTPVEQLEDPWHPGNASLETAL